MTKKDKLIKWCKNINSFDDLEDWCIGHPLIEDTKIEESYWTLSRFKDTLVEMLWYHPCNFIGNIIKYRKVLWNDRWFDYAYLLYMIQSKLEEDAKLYRKSGMCTTSDKAADEMERTLALLKRITEDEYNDLNQAQKDIDKVFEYMSYKLRGWWD
jgi:hypothetical protein